MPGPAFYLDLSKTSDELLSKQFPANQKFTIKAKSFKAETSYDAKDGSFPSLLEKKHSCKCVGADVTLAFEKNKIKADLEFPGKLADGVNVKLGGVYNTTQAYCDPTVEVTFQNASAAASLKVVLPTPGKEFTVTANAVTALAEHDIALGVGVCAKQMQLDTVGAKLQYKRDNMTFVTAATRSMAGATNLDSNVSHKLDLFSKASEVAAEVKYAWVPDAEDKCDIAAVIKSQVDANSTVRARFSNAGMFKGSVEHKLGKNATVLLGTSFDVHAGKFGGYGLHFTVSE
jgi:hypothetical protein